MNLKQESIIEKFTSMFKKTDEPKFVTPYFDFTKGNIENAKHGIPEECLATNRTDGKGFNCSTISYYFLIISNKL